MSNAWNTFCSITTRRFYLHVTAQQSMCVHVWVCYDKWAKILQGMWGQTEFSNCGIFFSLGFSMGKLKSVTQLTKIFVKKHHSFLPPPHPPLPSPFFLFIHPCPNHVQQACPSSPLPSLPSLPEKWLPDQLFTIWLVIVSEGNPIHHFTSPLPAPPMIQLTVGSSVIDPWVTVATVRLQGIGQLPAVRVFVCVCMCVCVCLPAGLCVLRLD